MREVVATATSTVTDVDIIEDRQLDSDEQDAVCSFVTATCGCNKGKQVSTLLSEIHGELHLVCAGIRC